MVKIGAELPKLFPKNKTGYPLFWTTLYVTPIVKVKIG